jgi:predicted dehydrogenase
MSDILRNCRIGLIGCGRISQTYVDAMKFVDNAKIVAVLDSREEAANATAEQIGCKAFQELDPFIRESSIDAAIICAPPYAHHDLSCHLMKHKIHVLCEKPLAISLGEGADMIRVAEENQVILMMASKFRYVEDIIRARSIIYSGMLGKMHFYENYFCSKLDMRQRWNSNPEISGGGVMIDNGPHAVDIVRYLLGPINKVFAHENDRSADLVVEDTVNLSFITDKNIMGSIKLSWSLDQDRPHFIELNGTEGALKIGWKHSAYQHNGHPEWVCFGVGYNKIDAIKKQLNNFVSTLRGSDRPLINQEEAFASLAVIEAAYRSLKSGQWVDVERLSNEL